MRARQAKKLASRIPPEHVGRDRYRRLWRKLYRAGPRWWPVIVPAWMPDQLYGRDPFEELDDAFEELHESCYRCVGTGRIHDCGEDTRNCLDPDDVEIDGIPCPDCDGAGSVPSEW